MPEIIIKTRVTPKKTTGNIVFRKRLTKLLNDNIDKNLILICCPAGYGKTTLVQDYLLNYNKAAAWFQVTGDITNFYSFITYIIHSLKILNENFGKDVLEVIDSIKESMNLNKELDTIISTIIGNFVNEFLQFFQDDVILVIDDLHHAGSSKWVNSMFNSLFENFPENLHIIITTRQKPDFDLTRMRAKRKVLELGVNDLNFDNDEITEVLQKIYSIQHPDKSIELFSSKLNGWITGIHLIVQAYGKDLSKIKLNSNIIPENIFEFFANDIFKNLDDNIQNFLLNTALLDNFTSELCDWLLSTKDNKTIIELLLKKNIFIESVQTKTEDFQSQQIQVYNYHSLFKNFLLSRLKDLKTENEIQNIYLRISEYYKNNGNMIPAINSAISGRDYTGAIPLIIDEFQRLYKEGMLEIIWKWVEQLPSENITKSKYILFFKGILFREYQGDVDKAYQFLNNALNIPETNEDEQLLIDCSIQLASTLILMGKPDAASESILKVFELNSSNENRVKLIYTLARAYYRIGAEKYEDIIKLLNEGLELCENDNLKSLQRDIYDLLGNIYHQRGEFVKSLFYYEIIVKNQTNIYRKFLTLTDIVLLHCWSGNFVKAKSFLNEAMGLKKRYPSLLFERNYLKTTALFDFEIGDYESSLIKFEELIQLDIKSNIKYFIFWYYLFIGECFYYLNKLDISAQNYEISLKYIDEKDSYQKMEYELHKAILAKKTKTNISFEKVLLKALKYFEDNSLIYSKAQIEFHLADHYYKSNLLETSLQYLESSLNISAEKQYLSYLEQSLIEFRYLFDFASANRIQKEFISSILSGVTDKFQYNWLSDECKERTSNDSKKINDIYLKTFGGAEIYVRGNPISENKWIRKKSKQIFIYLLLNPTMKFTKEKIMDLFFQDVSVNSAENLFHQVVSNIRSASNVEYSVIPSIQESKGNTPGKTIKNTIKKTGKEKTDIQTEISPGFVIYDDKLLRLNPDYSYKVDTLIFNKLFSTFKSSGTGSDLKIDNAKKLIEIYEGEFMAGNYESWCEELRENYISKIIDICENVIQIFKDKKLYYDVITYCEKLLQIDKIHEEAYINIIETYSKIGNMSMARQKFSTMLKTYQAEYGEKPSKTTLDKIQIALTKE